MVTVICPFYNEIRFVKAWLANVRRFADMIISADTGCTDGTVEYLESKGVSVIEWAKLGWDKWEFNYNEYKLRQHMLEIARSIGSNYIVRLDADEFIDDQFVDFVNNLPDSMQGRKIARMREQKFWGDLKTLRKPSLWPPFSVNHGVVTILRNYRGATGALQPLIWQADCNYWRSVSHPLISDGRNPRITYRKKWITLDTEIPYYHVHYAFPEKPSGELRAAQRSKKVPTKPFTGTLPEEIKLITGYW